MYRFAWLAVALSLGTAVSHSWKDRIAVHLARQPPSEAVGQANGEAVGQANGTYTLDSTVRAVVLDFTVTDRNGNAVPNLQSSNFIVTEDGRPQRVRYFQGSDAHVLPPAAASGKQGTALVRAAGDAPLTLLLLDHISTEPEDLAFARKQISDYLKKQPATLPSPTMLMALTAQKLVTLCDYTLNRDKLVTAVDHDNEPSSWYVLRDRRPGMKSTNLNTSGDRMAIYAGTLNELAAATESYPVRKNVIWVGPGVPALDQAVGVEADTRTQIRDALRPTVTRMLRARMTLYTVDPQGLLVTPTEIAGKHGGAGGSSMLFTAGGDPAEGELAFEQMAPETGGRIFRMRNDMATELGESVNDGQHYYTLSYDPSNKNYDGNYRRIHIEASDPNLIVRTREGYIASPLGHTSGDAGAEAMAFALASALHYDGVQVTARLDEAKTPPTLHVVADTASLLWVDSGTPLQVATVAVVYADIDRSGKILKYKVTTMHARAAAEATAANKAEFMLPVEIEPKTSLLRVLVRDSGSGHLGSFDLPLHQP